MLVSNLALRRHYVRSKFSYLAEVWTLIPKVYVPPSCDLPLLRYLQLLTKQDTVHECKHNTSRCFRDLAREKN